MKTLRTIMTRRQLRQALAIMDKADASEAPC